MWLTCGHSSKRRESAIEASEAAEKDDGQEKHQTVGTTADSVVAYSIIRYHLMARSVWKIYNFECKTKISILGNVNT